MHYTQCFDYHRKNAKYIYLILLAAVYPYGRRRQLYDMEPAERRVWAGGSIACASIICVSIIVYLAARAATNSSK